jgi:hypothetical protein
MDNQLTKGNIKLGDRVSIDKIVSKESGRTYYTFIALYTDNHEIDTLKEGQENRGD